MSPTGGNSPWIPPRARHIAAVLARHGMGFITGHGGGVEDTRPAHVRAALQEMGATFVKLGQVLSTRGDILPPDYRAELARLQDDVAPIAVEQVQARIAESLGHPVHELFASFDPVPLAAASIGQVHGAVLHDGRAVVVKVRRPGVVEQVKSDLDTMRHLAALAHRHWNDAVRFDLVAIVDEFANGLLSELDYLAEARNIERIAANFAGEPRLHVPWVDWTRTAPMVLTMERIVGIKPLDARALDAAHLDRHDLAVTASRMILKMVFEDGFYHADPHPGNFFFEPDGRIGLIDYGLMGTVDDPTREELAGLLLAVSSRDPARLVDALLDLGVAHGRVDRGALTRDAERMLRKYASLTLAELPLGPLVDDCVTLVREHGLVLPSRLALLLKTAVMAEGVGEELDPSFRLPVLIQPYARRIMRRLASPRRVLQRLQRAGLDAAGLAGDLPRYVRRFLRDGERGAWQVGIRLDDVDPLMTRLERLANRVVLGVLAAAFIVGLAVMLAAVRPSGFEGWTSRMVATGFVLVCGLGAYLAWSIVRPAPRPRS
ncbi:MAG: AarF/ABC1/UbiB kinase family protein [Gemmatimonadetes bacterium]|nr:AarF/ABC1/UbiB kinase family protein [Gemmatimonadota bacterium]